MTNLLTITISVARVIFRAGKERDGYVCNTDVCAQLVESMRIAKEEYPNQDHIFIFDNATTHTKLTDDTPAVTRMTLGPSFKVHGETVGPSGEKTKVKFAPSQLADGSPQELYYPADHPRAELHGALKGLAKLPDERQIPEARKLKLQRPTSNKRAGCPLGKNNCSAQRAMASQPNFVFIEQSFKCLRIRMGVQYSIFRSSTVNSI